MEDRFDPLIERINRNLEKSNMKEGTVSLEEGRLFFEFPYSNSKKGIYVGFVPEKINYDSLSIKNIKQIISPTNLYSIIEKENANFRHIPAENRYLFYDGNWRGFKNMEIAVQSRLYENEELFFLASFSADENKIISPNVFTDFVEGNEKYQNRLNRTKNPIKGIDLIFEMLKDQNDLHS